MVYYYHNKWFIEIFNAFYGESAGLYAMSGTIEIIGLWLWYFGHEDVS